ncbi:peptidase inhibitor 16 [Mytilus galloprovincialis]|uniref:Peptidase inhibitor 16 n=2 Tax=Mytilus galloprovincialis TaxID=29158 RepID=A0A8B6D5U2_MYTGA|nr:peptidase inhibitor 16 [Mytilus galloprovincialis]
MEIIYRFLTFVLWILSVESVIDISPYKTLLLDLHNDIRRDVKASNMQKLDWSPILEEEASRWAENCHFQIQRIGNGENLAMHTADKQLEDLLEEGFNMWSSGKDEYKYGDKLSSKTGHYTQLIWADTSKVGCSMKRCPVLFMKNGVTVKDAWFLVCFYNPPGNVFGKDPYIVGNSCKKCREGQRCDNGLCEGHQSTGTRNIIPTTNINQLFQWRSRNTYAPYVDKNIHGSPENICFDISPQCDLWRGMCIDRRYAFDLFTLCRKTCGFCHNSTCVDSRDTTSCKYWQQYGYCRNSLYAEFMAKNCAKTCNFC